MSGCKPSYAEKRDSRRAIRGLHKSIQENDVEQVRERLASLEVDVNFHYGGQSALQIAVINGNTEICRSLIEHGADVDKYNAEENSLLNMAAWRGYEDIVKLLCDNNAELDMCNNHGSTALNSACYKGYTGIAKALINADCDVNKPNLSGQTPLFTSAKENHVEVVRLLLGSSDCSIDRRDNERRSPLYIAAERGHLEIVQMLVMAGADLNAQEKYGTTALCVAAKSGSLEIVQSLVKGGADINLSDSRKLTPFYEAVSGRHIEVIKYLADSGCDLNIVERENEQTPMYFAVRQACQYFMGLEDHLAVVKLLLSFGAKVNDPDKFGWTPLCQSAFTGECTLTDLLLEAGAKLDVQSDSGDTPLHYSVYGNKPELVARLIEKGSNVNALNNNNELPLYKAIDTRSNIKIVSQLLEAGSLLDEREAEHQQSPLFAAIMHDYTEAVQLLIKFGCDVNLTNVNGDTALWVACDRGNEQLVSILLEHPDIDIDKGVEHVPLHSAVGHGFYNIAHTLLKAGANVNKMTELGTTAIYLACDTDRVLLINLLAKWGANPSAPHHLKPPRKCCSNYSDAHPHLELEPLYAAVKNDNFQAVKMVLTVTPRMPYWVLLTLKELIFTTSYAQDARLGQRTIVQYAHFFSGILSQPRCLKEECRGIIRETLGTAPFLKVSELPLPSQIQDYVIMLETFNYEEEMAYFNELKSKQP